MRRTLLFSLGLIILSALPLCAGELIQMGILLDTSGSMDGLIDQARGYCQ